MPISKKFLTTVNAKIIGKKVETFFIINIYSFRKIPMQSFTVFVILKMMKLILFIGNILLRIGRKLAVEALYSEHRYNL